MKKLCIVATTRFMIEAFMLNNIRHLTERFAVTIVVSEAIDFPEEFALKCHAKQITIARKISIWADIKALFLLWRYFRAMRFDLVFSLSPKAGLLAMVAAFGARIPTRIHCFTGQVWATKQGLMKALLRGCDKLIGMLAHHVLVDGATQRDFLIANKLIHRQKSTVLKHRSLGGVDTRRFYPNPQIRARLRAQYRFNDDNIVFIYIGRLNRDKGMLDLAKVIPLLFTDYPQLRCVLVGPPEEDILDEINDFLALECVYHLDYTSNPEQILNIADVLVLPSYREGFGVVVIEAAAMKIPAIVSDIYGLQSAVIDQQTGLFHQVGDITDMIKQYRQLIDNPGLIKKLGQNAYRRALEHFDDDELARLLTDFLVDLSK